MTALQQLEELVERYDASLEFNVGSRSAWAGTLRLTLTNPDQAPSRSITFHSTGGMGPEHVAESLLADVENWLDESDVKPLPVPDWMG